MTIPLAYNSPNGERTGISAQIMYGRPKHSGQAFQSGVVFLKKTIKRNKARELHVFEFQQTMVADNLVLDDATRLDPNSCELVAAYVSPEAP